MTVCSFITNTNLQHYSGDQHLSNFSQIFFIITMMFVSASVGFCALTAIIRAFRGGAKVGNFFVDMWRVIVYTFLPVAFVIGLLFIHQGMPMTFASTYQVSTLEPGAMGTDDKGQAKQQTIVVGPVTVEGEVVSSTRIRDLIAGGEMRAAARLLGRDHFLTGIVVHGRERGRAIGFPTANLQTATECLPPDGVYATRVMLPDGAFPSITNIGMRPTFAEPAHTIEAHIFDFDRDIYGAAIQLEIVERIRGERKFESGQALAAQIAQDLKRAKEILAAA